MEDFTIQDKDIAYTSYEDPIWRLVGMHWRGKLQTPQFNAHNKLCLKRIFWPCVTRCTQGSHFGFQVQGWRGHNSCVHCNGPKSLATCVTWMKKSSLGSRGLTKAQNNVVLKPCKMMIPIKTRWEYLISAIQFLISQPLIICIAQWKV